LGGQAQARASSPIERLEMRPQGLLVDYGGTLEEVSVDMRAGNEWLLSRASYRPAHVTLADVLERASRITKEVAERRDQVHLETAQSLEPRADSQSG
jgi:hypothetical protein